MSEQTEVKDQRGWHFTQVENIFLDHHGQFDIYEKMVYVCICRFANIHSKSAFPSAPRLAKMAGCSERKVRSCISALEQKGAIRIDKRKGATSIINLIPLEGALNTNNTPTPAHGAGPPLHDMPGTPAQCADELEKPNEKNITREKREETPTYEDKINQLKERYTESEQQDLEAYLDVIKRTRARKTVADSVVSGILEEFTRHDKERVLYGIRKHTDNPKLHDKREPYTYGIIRNATNEEMQKQRKQHKPGFFSSLAEEAEEVQHDQT